MASVTKGMGCRCKFLILKKRISKYRPTFHPLCTPYIDDLTSTLYMKVVQNFITVILIPRWVSSVKERSRFNQIYKYGVNAVFRRFDHLAPLFLKKFHPSHTTGLSYRPYLFRPNARKLKGLWASPNYNV